LHTITKRLATERAGNRRKSAKPLICCAAIGTGKSTIRNLEGLVELIPNPAHERSKLVRLTLKGHRFVEALTRREAKLIADLAVDISMHDVQTATKVLRELKDKFASGKWKRLLERVRGEGTSLASKCQSRS
jgi:hypothetical protein